MIASMAHAWSMIFLSAWFEIAVPKGQYRAVSV